MMKAITLMLTAASLLLVTHSATAGHHNKPEQADKSYKMQRGSFSYQKMLADVELTTAQQQQLQQLMAEHRSDKPKRERDNSERGAMRQLLQADYFDEVAVTELLQQQQQKRLAQRVAQLKLRHQVNQLLTPDQRQQLADKHQQRKRQWQQRKPEQSQ
ncbi:protein CpxP [Arsukibacterium tuosuense]|uniref:Protein CpxP n=1 Tax=Arsukibacterium tuosuense TaxID=1323745 RepID=A0A285JAZ8_9GAMM|nr:Spy/CpxP family protein refolding chaperone [Arsukibacterium tuosuense]SNY57444.1 protein CpxP [Arsukibacterium tuosuense]